MKLCALTLVLVALAAGPVRAFNINNDLPLLGDDTDGYETVTGVIEIPKGTHVKYETDEDTGNLFVDRILCYEVDSKLQEYPINYGFFPQTQNDDGDALDVLVPIEEAIVPHAYLKVRPIGIMQMVDTGEQDNKIVGVPVDDLRYENVTEASSLSQTTKDTLVNFFSNYKVCEGKNVTVDSTFLPASEAVAQLAKAHKTFLDAQAGKKNAPAVENDVFGRRRY